MSCDTVLSSLFALKAETRNGYPTENTRCAPFESLDLIFEKLVSLQYKVNLPLAHEKLAKAFSCHSRNKFRTITLDGRLTLDSWKFLNRECGPTIEEFVYGVCGRNVVEKHCPNLKSVFVLFYLSDRENMASFLENMKSSLTSVKINQQNYFPATIVIAVSEKTQLKEFFFRGYVDENGELHEFINVYL